MFELSKKSKSDWKRPIYIRFDNETYINILVGGRPLKRRKILARQKTTRDETREFPPRERERERERNAFLLSAATCCSLPQKRASLPSVSFATLCASERATREETFALVPKGELALQRRPIRGMQSGLSTRSGRPTGLRKKSHSRRVSPESESRRVESRSSTVVALAVPLERVFFGLSLSRSRSDRERERETHRSPCSPPFAFRRREGRPFDANGASSGRGLGDVRLFRAPLVFFFPRVRSGPPKPRGFSGHWRLDKERSDSPLEQLKARKAVSRPSSRSFVVRENERRDALCFAFLLGTRDIFSGLPKEKPSGGGTPDRARSESLSPRVSGTDLESDARARVSFPRREREREREREVLCCRRSVCRGPRALPSCSQRTLPALVSLGERPVVRSLSERVSSNDDSSNSRPSLARVVLLSSFGKPHTWHS